MKVGVRIVVAMAAMAMCSCLARQSAYMTNVDMQSWSRSESLAYDNNDTLSLRNLNIAIRYNDNYKASSLPLKLAISTPDERCFVDTLTLQLSHPTTAVALSTTESIPYRTDVLLKQRGAYIFAFEPLTEIEGIEAIGIELK